MVDIIYKSKVEETGTNAGISQYVLFSVEKNLFRIRINLESYEHQSYAILEHYNNSGWATMIRRKPQNYNIRHNYKLVEDEALRRDIFRHIIEDLINYAIKIAMVIK